MNAADTSAMRRVIDATVSSFEHDVLARSGDVPVLVDFWASWCGPCKALGPILEKLADAYHGAFLLAKVDVDAEQALAAHFQIRSIPTVLLLKGGQIVDGFAGALPESGVRQFLGKHGVTPLAAGDAGDRPADPRDPASEVERLRSAVEASPDKPELRLDLALALAENGEHAEAEALIETLPVNLGIDRRAQRARARIAFARLVEQAAAAEALEQAVEQNPDDLAARHRLGARLLLAGESERALEQFLEMLARDRNYREGVPRQVLVDAFNLIDDEALVRRYRRRMTALLF